MNLTRTFLLLPTLTLPLAGGCVGFINNDAGDEVGDTGDTTGDGDTTGGAENTIYEIQEGAAMGTFADGTLVSIKGVVVTSPVSAVGSLAFVEEPEGGAWSGISIYLWSEVALAVTLQPGDVVDIVGEYTEFYDASQIIIENVGDITVVSSAALPGPEVVAAGEVAREGPNVGDAIDMLAVAVDDFTRTVFDHIDLFALEANVDRSKSTFNGNGFGLGRLQDDELGFHGFTALFALLDRRGEPGIDL